MVGLDRTWALLFTVGVFGIHICLAAFPFNSKCAQLLGCLSKRSLVILWFFLARLKYPLSCQTPISWCVCSLAQWCSCVQVHAQVGHVAVQVSKPGKPTSLVVDTPWPIFLQKPRLLLWDNHVLLFNFWLSYTPPLFKSSCFSTPCLFITNYSIFLSQRESSLPTSALPYVVMWIGMCLLKI